MEPLVTIYEPERHGDRWVARADIHARGEHVQLLATASDRLASRARHLYDRAAGFVSRWVQYRGTGEPGKGIFGTLPAIGHALANDGGALLCCDPTIEDAAALFGACGCGDPLAVEQLARIEKDAEHDADAAAALEAVHYVAQVCACAQQGAIPMADVFAGANAGDPDACRILSTLRATRPRADAPVCIRWDCEDYLERDGELQENLADATRDELGARIMRPGALTARRIRPSYHGPMLRTYHQILSAWQ